MSETIERLAEVLADHRKECSSESCATCDCGWDLTPEEYDEHASWEAYSAYERHLADVIISRGEDLRARCLNLLRRAELQDSTSLSCDFAGNRWRTPIRQADLRAALNGGDA